MSLRDLSTDELINRIMQERISIEDLSRSQIKEIKYQAFEQQKNALRVINQFLIANPGTTLEFWKNSSQNYRKSVEILAWINQKAMNNASGNITNKRNVG